MVDAVLPGVKSNDELPSTPEVAGVPFHTSEV